MNKLNDPATGRQLHTISVLCLRHRIREPLEENKLTKGQAGELIRKLSNEKRN